jgi:hypothetical protein
LASLDRADEWLNSPPLMPAALRSKVALVNFWSYTCINCRRQLPSAVAVAAHRRKICRCGTYLRIREAIKQAAAS